MAPAEHLALSGSTPVVISMLRLPIFPCSSGRSESSRARAWNQHALGIAWTQPVFTWGPIQVRRLSCGLDWMPHGNVIAPPRVVGKVEFDTWAARRCSFVRAASKFGEPKIRSDLEHALRCHPRRAERAC
jgi:hypothetical protein